MQKIPRRNIAIVAHVDHGKSTLADRMLELSGTMAKDKIKPQTLDMMELERERGITIKMQPVEISWRHPRTGESVRITLIDTPGHMDFSYEVTRALKAVEGAVLLVDSTQGIQAQTLAMLALIRAENLAIIPVLSKTDLPHARTGAVRSTLSKLLGVSPAQITLASGKTGAGVAELLDRIVKEAPPPSAPPAKNSVRALVFDFKYSPHHGVILLLRMFAGRIRQGSPLTLLHSGSAFQAREVGIFTPFPTPSRTLEAGEIGYVVTGIKEPRQVRIGDTLTAPRRPAPPLPGFQLPQPKIWASFYPETQAQLNHLRRALERLQLSDSSLTYEEERSGVLGRGFRVGFLGLLHLDITAERLRREHQLKIIAAAPTLNYTVELRGGRRFHCRSAAAFPNHGMVRRVWEPWVRAKIFSPAASFSALASLWHEYEVKILNCTTLPDEKIVIEAELPLRELMRGFYDRLKSATSGYASLSYELIDEREGELIRLDVLLAGNEVPALARIVPRHRAEREARNLVQQLKETLPRQLYTIKIQARALGRIIAAEHLPALRKNVTAHLYGGDITRKKKLWQKQKRGKKKLAAQAKLHLPPDFFTKLFLNKQKGANSTKNFSKQPRLH